jgi:hypothetical protein
VAEEVDISLQKSSEDSRQKHMHRSVCTLLQSHTLKEIFKFALSLGVNCDFSFSTSGTFPRS